MNLFLWIVVGVVVALVVAVAAMFFAVMTPLWRERRRALGHDRADPEATIIILPGDPDFVPRD